MRNSRVGMNTSFKATHKFRRKADLFVFGAVVVSAIFFCGYPRLAAGEPKIHTSHIEQEKSGHLVAYYDLGAVPIDKPVDVVLNLKNESKQSFVISKVKPTCSCTVVSLSSGTLLPWNEIAITLSIKPLARFSANDFLQQVSLQIGVESFITLRIRYRLEGLLQFKSLSAMVSIGEGDKEKTFLLPLFVTAPIRGEHLQIKKSDELSALKTTIVEKDGEYFVQCTISDSKLGDVGASGTIEAIEERLGKKAVIPVAISKKPPMTVMPSFLRFSKDTDEEKSYRATALVRIDDGFLHWDGEERYDDLESYVEFEAKSTLGKWKVESKRVAKGLFRLYLTMTVERQPDGKPLIPEALELSAVTTSHDLSLNIKITLQ
jgi:hypothetical protein